ncbi:DNA endonuclease RBBP8-like [Venturia canescens]|uniref:DNA endonuclease RBBP8-like n=1 Tax=Venturia canescens TaxID=32260 RepID=UPI001C9CD99F|nr:DNA endonuclease RBBP8-like [Venturia canescens]XP_043277804.1 DNA endonuclease RBBP8-like [Venturia canescens]
MYSQDFVNTCTEYTAVDDSSLRTDKEQNLGKIRKKHPVPSNLKTSQRVPFKDSIDATFFTPTEIDVLRYDLKDKPPRNGCSKVTDPRGNSDRVRPFRRTSNKNSENLSVNFRNLIRNISASNSSPQKIKNSSQYARKGVKRNVAKKNKLRGWDCAQCEKYYANLDLSDIEIQKRKDKCSRHRSNFNPRYSTPPGFWNPEFPDSPNFCDSSDN